MPLKTFEHDGTKYGVLDAEGRPVYVDDAGKETGYDGEALATKLHEVNGESATRRRELKEANEKLKTFEGISDPAAAVKAIETVKNLDDKKLVDAGEVEKVKTEAIKATEEKYENQIEQQYKPAIKERDELKGALHKEMIGGRFARSKYIAEKLASPVPMIEAYFGQNFTIEEGKVVAKYANGNEIFSPSKPGERAEFDEALQVLVEASPFKDQILKGSNKSGTGAPGSGGGGPGGDKTMTRAEADKLAMENPAEMAKKMGEGYKVVDEAA